VSVLPGSRRHITWFSTCGRGQCVQSSAGCLQERGASAPPPSPPPHPNILTVRCPHARCTYASHSRQRDSLSRTDLVDSALSTFRFCSCWVCWAFEAVAVPLIGLGNTTARTQPHTSVPAKAWSQRGFGRAKRRDEGGRERERERNREREGERGAGPKAPEEMAMHAHVHGARPWTHLTD
jgi:hypothetical protein